MASTKKIILNVGFIGVIMLLLFVPSAKALFIRGLMEVGFFKPSINQIAKSEAGDLSQIRFKDAKGTVISLADCKGKVVFLNFWATWCPPCLAEMPSVNQFYEQFKGKEVVFLLIDADGDFAKAQAYMDRKKYAMPVYTFASDIPKRIFKGSLPTTVVFDRQGRISFEGEGAADYSNQKFTAFIETLLKN